MSSPAPVLRSAFLIGVCTLASRVTGLARDVLLAQTFGVTWVNDAWNYAFQIPNLFRRLFGEGALAAVFVPSFTRALEQEGREAAWRLLGGALGLLSVTLVGVVVVLELVVLVAWAMTVEGPDAAENKLLLSLTALMLPFMIGICLTALLASVLNAVGRFVMPALTPIILNLSMIVAMIWLAPTLAGAEPDRQIYVVALSVLAAGVLQVLFLLPVLRQAGVPLRWRWAPRDPLVTRAVTLMGPVLLGQGVLALGVFLDAQICALLTATASDQRASVLGLSFDYPLQAGALTSITFASRIYQFPLGVLAVSIGTAALPTFSRLVAQGQWSTWRHELTSALRMGLFVGMLAGSVLVAIPETLVRILFEYRAFTAADTARVADVLQWYGFAMWALFLQHIVVRAFYSLGDVRTPLKISGILLPANVLLSLVLIWQPMFREAGFAVSTAVTASAAVVIGLTLLRRRAVEPPAGGELFTAGLRMIAAGVLSGLVAYGTVALLADVAGLTQDTLTERVLVTSLALGVASAVYLGVSGFLRLPEAGRLVRQVMRVSRRTT